MKSYNYLDLLNERQLSWAPIHFCKTKISISESMNLDDMINWIRTKLNGRFYLNQIPTISTDDNHLKSTLVLGFEEEKELTYFMLACPFLRRN